MRWRRRGGPRESCQDFPPTARTSRKHRIGPVDLGLRRKIAARLLGKAIFLLLGFCPVGLVPVSDVKL